MIKRITKPLFLSVIAVGLLVGGYACSNDDYLSDSEIRRMIEESLHGQWQIIHVEISGDQWNWHEAQDGREGYHWVEVELPELDVDIFDDGAALAYYWFDENSKTALPYVKTWVGNDGIPYTETYSCDFVLSDPSVATFSLEASDVGRYDNPPDARFQIILIY